MRKRLGMALWIAWAVSGTAAAQDAVAVVWNQVVQAAFDPAKSAAVDNVTITRDRLRITLVSGTIQFTQPAAGRVFGAAFQGQGRLQISVPDPLEQQQLRVFGVEGGGVDMPFTEAVFNFSSDVFDELASHLKWNPSASGNLGDLYQGRMREWEERGSPLTPRVLQSVLSGDAKRDAFLGAELKTSGRGWMRAGYDARDREEVSLGRFADRDYQGQYDTWLSFPAGDRTAREAYADPFAKASFTIPGYQVQVTLESNTEMSATARVKVNYRVAGDRVLLFTLHPNLRVDSVRDETGVALPFFQPREPKDRTPTYGDYLAVALPAPMQPGEHVLEFHYGGKRVVRNVGAGNFFVPSYGWYPGYGDDTTEFSTRSDFDLTFHFPKKFSLVATGDKTGENSDGKETTATWKSPIPLAVAGFAFGQYKVTAQQVGNVSVEVYVNKNQDDLLGEISKTIDAPEPISSTVVDPREAPTGPQESRGGSVAVGGLSPAEMIKTMNSELANTVRLFQNYFGPLPYDRIAMTNIPYSYGQGWPTLIYLSAMSFLDATQRNALGIKDQIEVGDYFRAHEMSHQWWGHRVGWKSYHDQWLSEGFAQFSGNLYVQFRQNPDEYMKRIRLDKERLLYKSRFGHVYNSLGPVWMGNRLGSSEAVDGYDKVIYLKGGLILHELRMLMRDAQNQDPDHFFKEMLQDYCKTYDNKAASTEDFKAIVEKHMLPNMDLDGNHTMDWFFRQYVYGTGIPEYKLDYTVEQNGDKWDVSGTMTQAGVPDGWKDAVRLYLHLPGRGPLPIGWLQSNGKSAAFKLALPVKPEKLTLNDNEDTFAVIK